MVYLSLATVVIALSASLLYSRMEGWPYFDCLYFCFVTFSTIGFGDLVTSQEPDYPQRALYRFANFALIVAGCCCIYSLFNVTSIVIKQLLNWIMRTLDVKCRPVTPPPGNLLRLRRNAITMNYVKKQVGLFCSSLAFFQINKVARSLSRQSTHLRLGRSLICVPEGLAENIFCVERFLSILISWPDSLIYFMMLSSLKAR